MDSQEEVRYNDQPESKGFRIAKNIFKGLLFGASAVVWVLIFWVIISTREPSFYGEMIFSEKTRAAASADEQYEVWQLHVQTWMNYDNSISVSGVWYAEDTGELEIGFRFNTKLTRIKDESGNSITTEPVYVLSDDAGKTYAVSNLKETVIGRYRYFRVCFSDVRLALSGGDRESQPVLRLTLTRAYDGEPLAYYYDNSGVKINDAELVIFNAETVVQKTAFES